MSYTVLALKWRPQNFDEIIGQDHIVATLKSTLAKNRLAHAYLFAGPRGVGKTSTARIFAKALNCKEGPTVNPCQKCTSCLEITQGRSLDVIEIDGASNRGIDEVRVLRENVKFAPSSGRFKIYIIDEVHMLTTEAFNALLKTLEEPPAFVKFVFATTQPNKVLPTILSRCQRFDFRRIPALEIISQLEKITAQENIQVDKDVLFAIAKASDGSLRDAESLLDQLSSFSKDKISLQDVVSILGIVEQEALFEITDRIIHKNAKATLELFNSLIDEGKDINVFMANLIEHFRNLMIARITKADSKLIDLPQGMRERLLEQAHNFSLEEIFSIFNLLVNTQEMSKRLDSLRIPLEIALVKLTHDKRGTTSNTSHPSVVHERPISSTSTEKSKEINENKENKDRDTVEQDTEVNNSLALDNVKDSWQNIIETIGKVKMSVATFLNEGSPVKLDNCVLTVAFPKNYSLHKESLETKENRSTIERILSELFKVKLKVNFILTREAMQREDEIDNPVIKSALEKFGARIIDK